jgi:hypothetical protein
MTTPAGNDNRQKTPDEGVNQVANANTAVASVVLRGLPVVLTSDVGKAFVADCARNTEGLLSDAEVKDKWGLIDEDWAGLAGNAPVLAAVRAERDRRVASGLAAKEAAQRHFARAQTVLGDILNDEQVAPRHRIEAARELRQVAGSGPENPLAGEKVSIIINMGDEQFVKEFIQAPVRSDDGEVR